MPSELLGHTGYSPDLQMDLMIGSERFEIAQMCDGMITLRDARQMPPDTATIRLVVGGSTTTFEIQLPHGIDPARRKQSYRLLKTIEEAAA
jgi:hypothetical protein